MSDYVVPPKFLVAFSLAGEQRDLVRPIAEAVEKVLGRPNVFYDEWFEHYIAGSDADLKLQEIYGERCVLAVTCISGNYGDKPWTQAEHQAIRARYMQANERHDQLGILPIRVGDGEVDGINFNAIVPDIRKRSADDAAKLILDRLQLVMPELGKEQASESAWPTRKGAIHWPMADHTEACQAFETLLSPDTPFRLLSIKGASEVGKSHMTKQMLANALHVDGLACGRLDFKGAAGLENEIKTFVQHLGIPQPSTNTTVSGMLGEVFENLRERKQPTLLIFDTYEQVGEAQHWLENIVLTSLIRSEWLRVVVAGQMVPENSSAMLGAVAAPIVRLQPPTPADWHDYGKIYEPDLELDFVDRAHMLCGGKASILAGLLGPRG